ncbi:MAG: GNAT family N-acetyltransferase [Deltaproteobacteria bacterium]|nr:GNAT family N-acetyltransferase [Deltaproteobacteria bacterium]
MPLELGPAKREEAREIAFLSRDLVEDGLVWRYRPEIVDRLIRDRDTEVVVAREAGRLVGFGVMSFGDASAHLLLFAVRKDRQRSGLGRSLMEWLLLMARTAGLDRVHVEVRSGNASARAFYRRIGFREVAHVPGYYQGRESAVRAVLSLGAPRR